MTGKLIGFRKTPDYLNNYRIYTGKIIPRSEMNKEHVIPKSLGGNASTRIYVQKKINERFGSEIDGRIEKDFMVRFGRRDAEAKGHGNTVPIPEWRRAVRWQPTQPLGTGTGSYTLKFPKEGAYAFDPRTQTKLPPSIFNESPFVIWNMEIDHIARFKFTMKTLLGIGWKLFREDLIKSIDVDLVRHLLLADIQLIEGKGSGAISFTDGFLEKTEEGRAEFKRLESVIVRKNKTTIMIRQEASKINWSVSCVGYFVGSMWIPLSKNLLADEAEDGNGLLLTYGREGFEVDSIPRHILAA